MENRIFFILIVFPMTINMNFINEPEINNFFYHNDEDNTNDINIYYDLDIDTYDYINGSNKKITYLNNQILDICIEPFTDNFIFPNLGINKGSLIINYKINTINKEKWISINNADKNDLSRILFSLKMI